MAITAAIFNRAMYKFRLKHLVGNIRNSPFFETNFRVMAMEAKIARGTLRFGLITTAALSLVLATRADIWQLQKV